MKTLQSTLMVLALSIGIAGAFANSTKATAKAQDTVYSWQHYDQTGMPLGPPVNGLSEASARLFFGCPGYLQIKCAEALGGPIIWYN